MSSSPSSNDDASHQRAQILECLIPEYWMPEGAAIVDAAVREGYSLNAIASIIAGMNVEALILNTYYHQIDRIRDGFAR